MDKNVKPKYHPNVFEVRASTVQPGDRIVILRAKDMRQTGIVTRIIETPLQPDNPVIETTNGKIGAGTAVRIIPQRRSLFPLLFTTSEPQD